MALSDGTDIKVVQAINMPQSVEANNVFYFKCSFTDDQEEEDMVDELETWIEALYGVIDTEVSDSVSLGTMKVYKHVGLLEEDWELIGEASPTFVGLEAGDMMPHGVSALSRAYSNRAGTVGRKYIPGFAETEWDDGVLNAGAITGMGQFNVLWGTDATISAGNYMDPGVFGTGTLTVHPLTGVFVVLTNAAYQRRRRPGVGS